MQVIIYESSNGGVVVKFPCECGLTIEQIAQKDVPAGCQYRIVDESSLPDYGFQGAWEFDEPISVNINKAREIRKDQLRVERAPLLAALDIEFQRAIETSSDTSAIVAEKERLRDITLLCDAPEITLEGLKAITC